MKITPRIKKWMALVIACGLVAFAGLIITGCVAPNPAPPTVVSTPNPIPGLPPVLVTNPPMPAYIPDPRIAYYSNLAQQWASTAALVPPAAPYVDLAKLAIAGIGAVLGGISGYFAQKKNTNAVKEELGTNQTMLASVIQGVESSTAEPTTSGKAVKSAIQDRATAAGVQYQLDKVVKRLT